MYEASNTPFRSPRVFVSGNSTPNSSTKSFKRNGSFLKVVNFARNQQYHPQDNKLTKNSVYYDNSVPFKDSSFQKSIRTNQSQQGNSYSQKRSLGQSQYSVSNFQGQRKKYDHQLGQLRKDMQKLRRQIQFKDKQIAKFQQNRAQFKEIQMELVETYRVINYFQGKMKEHQKLIQYHQNNLNLQFGPMARGKLKDGLDFKEIIQFFREQSIQLKGQLEKSNHQNTKITLKLNKLQVKYNNLQKTLNEATKKQKVNPSHYQTMSLHKTSDNQKVATIYQTRLQISQNKLVTRRGNEQVSQTSSVRSQSSNKGLRPQNTLSQKSIGQAHNQKLQISKIYGNFNSKINKIERELDFFKIQNQKIHNELNQKIIQMGQIALQNDELKFMLTRDNHTQLVHDLQIITPFMLKGQKKEKGPLGQLVLSKKLSQPESKKSRGHHPSLSSTHTNHSVARQKSYQSTRKGQFKNLTLNQISKKIQQIQSKSYKFEHISEQTVRKLRYNLIREDTTYTKLLQIISDKLVGSQNPKQISQLLQDIPYQLTFKQSQSFLFQYKKIWSYLKQQELSSSKNKISEPDRDFTKQEERKIIREKVRQVFKENIPTYKNITLRRDASLTAQLTKTFKNRLAQLQPYLKDKKRGLIHFEEAGNIFRQNWHLGEQQIDFIFLKSCQESRQFNTFDFYKTINFFLQN